MHFEALTVFPEMFDTVLTTSILGRAKREGYFTFNAYDLRTWTYDVHRTVDDAPYGGGAGMLMKPEPFYEGLDTLRKTEPEPYVIAFTPAGKPFTHEMAQSLTSKSRIAFLCGRYEGIDERVMNEVDLEISLGDFVLTGGELAAMVVMDAVIRLIPGVLGDDESAADESFVKGLLEYSQYTRPAEYRGLAVPEILRSGNHAAIDLWRRQDSLKRTFERRPDLLASANLTEQDKIYIQTLKSQQDKGQ